MLRRIKAQRLIECKRIRSLYLVMSIIEGVMRNGGILLWFPLIFIEVGRGQYLSAVSLFPTIGILNSISQTFITLFSMSLNCLSLLIANTARMQEVLLLPDSKPRPLTDGPRVLASNLTTSWPALNLFDEPAKKEEEQKPLLFD